MSNQDKNTGFSHEKIETSNFLMIVLILVVVAFGGIVEIVPLFFQKIHYRANQGSGTVHSSATGRARYLHS